MSWLAPSDPTETDGLVQRRLRIGAVGALGALTLLWLANVEPMLFPLGTVLLTMSMVPLAGGFRARGGLLVGLLFGVLWVIARLDAAGTIATAEVLHPANLISVSAMVALGVFSGAIFGFSKPVLKSAPDIVSGRSMASSSDESAPTGDLGSDWEERVGRALREQRAWMGEWDRQEDPWASFDSHIRQQLRYLTSARRVRCYDVDIEGNLAPLNAGRGGAAGDAIAEDGLIQHVVLSGRRFLAGSKLAGEMVHELAETSTASRTWVVPLRSHGRTCGLITVGSFDDAVISEERLNLAADLIEEFWTHVQEADRLRIATQVDRSSGVLDRVEILAVLDQTVETCYAGNEPVVMLSLVIEGIRSLDDGGQWEERNDVVEAIGKIMGDRLRHDDVVGRFSDDRFIAVLRRLDEHLAHLIARKILREAEAELLRRFPDTPLTLRAGLAGSGFAKVDPQQLLLKSFEAIHAARRANQDMLPRAQDTPTVTEKT